MKPEGTTRILSNISTMDEALKVEEAMKSGYVEAIVENIVHWIGAEEDLADSYEEFSKSLSSPEEREAANQLVCHHCKLIYRIEDDIPIMLIDEATPLAKE